MKRLLFLLLSLSLLAAAPPDEELRSTALRWLARVDAEDKGPIYAGLTQSVKATNSRAEILNKLREARGRLGEAKRHKVLELKRGENFAVVRIQSVFEDSADALETVWLSEDPDATWRVSGYELLYQGSTVISLGATPKAP